MGVNLPATAAGSPVVSAQAPPCQRNGGKHRTSLVNEFLCMHNTFLPRYKTSNGIYTPEIPYNWQSHCIIINHRQPTTITAIQSPPPINYYVNGVMAHDYLNQTTVVHIGIARFMNETSDYTIGEQAYIKYEIHIYQSWFASEG